MSKFILENTLRDSTGFNMFFSLMIDQFSPSVKMSTYLLAVAVLDNFAKVRKMTKKTAKPVEVCHLFRSLKVGNIGLSD